MIYVDVERCTGCEKCLEGCPTGAISMQKGVASIDEVLCNECGVCFESCPQGAILSVEVVEPAAVKAAAVKAAEVKVRPDLTLSPQNSSQMAPLRLRDAFGLALLWAGRELVPRLAGFALDRLDRWTQPDERPLAELGMRPESRVARQSRGGRGRRQGRRRRQRFRNNGKA